MSDLFNNEQTNTASDSLSEVSQAEATVSDDTRTSDSFTEGSQAEATVSDDTRTSDSFTEGSQTESTVSDDTRTSDSFTEVSQAEAPSENVAQASEQGSGRKGLKVFLIILLIVAAIALGIFGCIWYRGFQIDRKLKAQEKLTVEKQNMLELPTTDESTPVVSDTSASLAQKLKNLDPSTLSVSTYDYSAVADCVMPSVVAINCSIRYSAYDFFGRKTDYKGTSAGTGFIIAQRNNILYLATNNHVVDQSVSITVTLYDGTQVNASVVGTDSDYDLAIISVNMEELSDITLECIRIASVGDSDLLKVGDRTIAIGNAVGYGQSTTVGCVSALNRTIEGQDFDERLFIQTDTAINPGNSGGPLLNAYGQVIGINSNKLASSEIEGMCYAIPISVALPIINELINYVPIDEKDAGYLGIEAKDISQTYATGFNMPVGVYVYSFKEDSPAINSDLLVGDIITAINGRNVYSMNELNSRLDKIRAGREITLTVKRLENGSYNEYEVKITLGSRKRATDSRQ